MNRAQLTMLSALLVSTSMLLPIQAESLTFEIKEPLSPPGWALLQRQLLNSNAEACSEFFNRYFDERGYLMCIERWGGDDGPDDAIENCRDWPLLHALGSDDTILTLYKKAWEGHLRQYTEAKTIEVPFARDGMYYKEFPVMFDWQHNAEGLRVFNLQGLSDPGNRAFQHRVKRYAGFYMNEDPGALNYDPEHRIIRSMINGSRGPLMRKATALDWTGDPIEVEHRFDLAHGERSYEEMLAHFKDYNDVVGDHPLNLLTTSLAINAYMLTGENKYRDWLLEYVEAWRKRMVANGNIIPSNIGLNGVIGGECNGKWYGGTYGWGFSVIVPQTGDLAHRNRTYWSFVGFMNAYLLTGGDDRWLDIWRKQADIVNSQMKVIDGQPMYPHMFGDEGWYHYQPEPYTYNNMEIYYLSMKAADRDRVPPSPWLQFLSGDNPDFPETAMRQDLEQIRQCVVGMRQDQTTPDTRLADDPMKYNPARVSSLLKLMLGGIQPGRNASILHCRLRYFDPANKRAGIPDGVAALIENMTDDSVTLTLVNTDQLSPKQVVLQGGGYAEHDILS
ncbi:MAG: hypothetical protein MK103_15005, partial [Planctomycetes bacterium]|nr:hypothetical protein [Planctomycetota bacterium]